MSVRGRCITMRGSSLLLGVAAVLLGGCIDAEPVTPDFEQRLFGVLGGLEVGEALTLFGEDAESIVLEGGEGGARYLFVPFLAAEEGAVRLRIEVSGEKLEELETGSASLSRLPDELVSDRHAHLHLRRWEQEHARSYLRDRRARIRGGSEARVGVAERATDAPAVGETVTLRVINRSSDNVDLCENPHLRTGRVTALTEHAILVEDTLNPVELSPADVQRIAQEYEELVYPVAVENFGAPTDVDGNGRVYIFMTSALNEAAARAGGGITVGFTFALDLLPRVSEGGGPGCSASNEGEIFYLIAPDPQAELGVQVPEDLVRRLSTAIIVHELQHMINSGRRLYEVPDAREFEALWLNEGLSHIAEELVFYAATGLRPRTEIGWERVTTSEATFSAYSRFIRDNMSIYSNYLDSPDSESLMGKSPNDDDFTTRGATWAFLRYLADQTPSPDAELFHSLVNSPVGGLANLRRALETEPLTWMQRWTVSNFADNLPTEEGIDERFTQPSWDFRSIYEGEMGVVPLSPRLLQPGQALTLSLRGGGSSYIVLQAAGGGQARLNTIPTSSPVFGEFRASVVRLD